LRWGRPEDLAFLATLPADAPPLRNMPELWPECAWYLEAFKELTWSRPLGMSSLGYIPVGEIVAWAAANAVEDVPTLIRHVRALDALYVADWTERQKRESERREGRGRDQDRRADECAPDRLAGAP
jgi:hypothetical protein